MAYTKPHLSHEGHLARMRGRGLVISDETEALSVLASVGYYRFTAYIYPFRQVLPTQTGAPSSLLPKRSDMVRVGTTFAQVDALRRFDRDLRFVALRGLETFELALRAQVAYVLGARDPMGHLSTTHLDSMASPDRHRLWLEYYETLQDRAAGEDFIKHHLQKYGHDLPIWIAVELLDFGALAGLLSLLDRRDQNLVASAFGVKGGVRVSDWARHFNYLRNVCAHHSRLWNRTLTFRPGRFNTAQVGADLHHALPSQGTGKVYYSLALLAYLVRHVDPRDDFVKAVQEVMQTFPVVDGISPESDMGFISGWATMPLWTPR